MIRYGKLIFYINIFQNEDNQNNLWMTKVISQTPILSEIKVNFSSYSLIKVGCLKMLHFLDVYGTQR